MIVLKWIFFCFMMKVGLLGEKLSIYTDEGSSNVTWSQYENPRTLTWYKVSIRHLYKTRGHVFE